MYWLCLLAGRRPTSHVRPARTRYLLHVFSGGRPFHKLTIAGSRSNLGWGELVNKRELRTLVFPESAAVKNSRRNTLVSETISFLVAAQFFTLRSLASPTAFHGYRFDTRQSAS